MNTMRAMVQDHYGAATELRRRQVGVPAPDGDEVLIRVSYSAVNFADDRLCQVGVNHFTGRVEQPPFIPGGEVVGARSDSGGRVVAISGLGGYAQYVAAPAELVFDVPDDVDDEAALTTFVPGLTAAYLLRAVAPLGTRSVVVNGASGAVGTILLQLLSNHPGTVVATATSAAPFLFEGSAATVVVASPDELADRVVAVNSGAVDVVFDPIGGPVFDASLAMLAAQGVIVTYGNASGGTTAVDPRSLIVGSRRVEGFWLMDWLRAEPAGSRAAVADLFAKVAQGQISTPRPRLFGLSRAAEAMAASHERGARGRVLLSPWSN